MNFNVLEEILDNAYTRWKVPACECVVYQNHKRIFYHHAGYSNLARTKAAGPKDLYWIYSFTKLFTMTLTLRLMEKGLLKLEDPIEKFLPSWSDLTVRREGEIIPCQVRPTILHLMTMAAGPNYKLDSPSILKLYQKDVSTISLRMVADALSGEPLDFEPGEHFQYSLCHDLLGAVLEVAAGRPFAELMQEHIIAPLGMIDTTFFPSEKQYRRLSRQYQYISDSQTLKPIGKRNPFVFSPLFASGGAGLMSCSQDLALLCDALANLGVGATGVRILEEESVRLMAKAHLTEAQKKDFNTMKPHPYSYGLGVRTLTEPLGRVPAGEFGWDGAAGSYNLIDTDRHFSLVYTQHVIEHNLCYGEIHPLLRDTLYEILDRG